MPSDELQPQPPEDEESARLSQYKEKITKALIDFKGNITRASEAIGINRRTLTRYLADDPQLKEVQLEAKEVEKDFYEECLRNHAEKNVVGAIFYLKTQARDRGYIENPEPTPPPIATQDPETANNIKNVLDDYFNEMKKVTPPTKETNDNE